MKSAFKTFVVSSSMLFLAWVAKMQFIFGGDYLFRIGTIGIVVSFVWMLVHFRKDQILKSSGMSRMFSINLIVLAILYLGMMLKVSHIMNSQIEKDLVLDFIGIPAFVGCMIYNFANSSIILGADNYVKSLLCKHIALPWLLFLFSFMLYALYSAILAVANHG
ncbi:MAG: hypothetical protein ACK5C5_03900 [Bacteroidota bacterium]|jgi:hypothetical protein